MQIDSEGNKGLQIRTCFCWLSLYGVLLHVSAANKLVELYIYFTVTIIALTAFFSAISSSAAPHNIIIVSTQPSADHQTARGVCLVMSLENSQ